MREVVRIENLWEGPCAPSPHAGRGDGDDELLIALDGGLAGRSECGGPVRARGGSYALEPGGWMRSRVRRRLARARKLAASGYRDIAAGRPVKA